MLTGIFSVLSALFRDPASQFWFALFAVLLTTLSVFVQFIYMRKRKEITYRVITDTKLLASNETYENDIQLLFEGQRVQDMRLLLLKIWNSGNTELTSIDYDQPLKVSFGAAKALSCSIVETEPSDLLSVYNKKTFLHTEQEFVEIPRLLLNPKESMTLRTLLYGYKGGVSIAGRISNGSIKVFDARKTLNYRLRTGLMLSIVLVIVLSGSSWLYSSGVLPNILGLNSSTCASGSLVIGGSSDAYPLVMAAARQYTSQCSLAHISVISTTSEEGIFNIGAGNIQIAISDLPQGAVVQKDLVDHAVAVIPFAVVVNKDVSGIINLSEKQLQQIYNGSINNWNQLGGPDIPVVAVSRNPTSSARETFDTYVLHGQGVLQGESPPIETDTSAATAAMIEQTPGAIGYIDLATVAALTHNQSVGLSVVDIDGSSPTAANIAQGTYHFWAVERLYTKGTPAANSLTALFLKYMTDSTAQALIKEYQFISLQTVPTSVFATH